MAQMKLIEEDFLQPDALHVSRFDLFPSKVKVLLSLTYFQGKLETSDTAYRTVTLVYDSDIKRCHDRDICMHVHTHILLYIYQIHTGLQSVWGHSAKILAQGAI